MTHMRRALSLARRALGSASPNPAVGAVVAKDGEIVGEGWTQPPGQDHAEIVALRQAGSRAAGASLYVTLEPCNHHGRSPPCTDAIVEAGIAEVHAATLDPNPTVRGGGISRLDEAGVSTHVGEREAQAREVMEAYLRFVTAKKPFVTAKFAMSLDGKIATRTGDSKWITGERARWYVHRLRAESDAVMVGVNTVLTDDPQLTSRTEKATARRRQPLRVVVDSRGRTPPGARLLSEPGRTLIAVGHASEEAGQRLGEAGAEVAAVSAEGGSVDLGALLSLLGRREITSLLVEGGGTLLGSLFDQGLVDKVVAFVAPAVIGGREAPSPVEGDGVATMGEALRLERVRWRRFGRDIAIIGYC